jgi:hypothetical protein
VVGFTPQAPSSRVVIITTAKRVNFDLMILLLGETIMMGAMSRLFPFDKFYLMFDI